MLKAIVEAEVSRPSAAIMSESENVVAQNRNTSPDKLRRQLRVDLDAILLKGLRKDPSQRYVTAEAFAEDLRRYLSGEAVVAQPESSWYRSKKFLWRRRWAVASVASVVLALAAGLSAALWQAHVAKNESRVARAMEGFLEDIFRANTSSQDDPVKARQTTARELLDIGSRKIDQEMADVPEAKLRILGTLGSMYSDLGLGDQSVVLRRKSVDLARSHYGNNSLELVVPLINLGGAMHTSGSMAERERVLLEAKRILDEHRDFTSQQRGNLCIMLAQHYESLDLNKALDYSRQAADVYRRYPRDSMAPEALYEEALMLPMLGRSREAEPLLKEAIQMSIQIDGDPQHQSGAVLRLYGPDTAGFDRVRSRRSKPSQGAGCCPQTEWRGPCRHARNRVAAGSLSRRHLPNS